MPRMVTIGLDVTTTQLGLGCAGIFRKPSRVARRRLLEVAFDCGIRHFDVAPMYGLGCAEPELGRFVRGRRNDVTIATKFGISPTVYGRFAGAVQAPVRFLLERRPGLSQAARERAAGPSAGPTGAFLYQSLGYDAVTARKGLDDSLRSLATDYLDVFLLHDPKPGSVRSEELCAFFEKAVAAGKVRSWGVAGEPDPTSAVLADLPSTPPIVQLPYDIASSGTDSGVSVRFGVIGSNLSKIQSHLADAQLCRRWSDDIGRDCSSTAVLAELLLRSALRDTRDGVVLYSSVQESRLHEAAALSGVDPRPDDSSLERFQRLAAHEL